MDISIVIVTWNTRDLIKGSLRSLEAEFTGHTPDTIEIFVVDNLSTDGTAEMIRSEFPQVKLIVNSRNRGFAAANNQALSQSTGRYILILNPDTEIRPGGIKKLVEFLDTDSKTGAVGPLLLNADGTLQLSCDPEPTLSRELWRLLHLDRLVPYGIYPQGSWPRDEHREVDVIKGACMLVRGETLDQIGLFDEEFFIYSEEVDLCYRIRQAGWQIQWVPQAEVVHYGGQSTKQVASEMFQLLYKYKLIYFRKNHGHLAAAIYKVILAFVSSIRILLYPLAAWRRRPAERAALRMLAGNYATLLVSLPGM
ncbi:MAG: glycosyltransferase family 2 protein [Chloroflexota bacterium]